MTLEKHKYMKSIDKSTSKLTDIKKPMVINKIAFSIITKEASQFYAVRQVDIMLFYFCLNFFAILFVLYKSCDFAKEVV